MQTKNIIKWELLGKYLFVGLKKEMQGKLQEIKTKKNLDITFCDNGFECFNILETQKINYLIVNEEIGDTSFMEVIMLVRSKISSFNMPIFLILNGYDPEIEYDAYSAGVDDLLIKPFDIMDFFKIGMDYVYAKSLNLKDWADAVNLEVSIAFVSENEFVKRLFERKIKKIKLNNIHFAGNDEESLKQVATHEMIFVELLNPDVNNFNKMIGILDGKGMIKNNLFLVIHERHEPIIRKIDVQGKVKNYIYYPFEVMQLIHSVKVVHFLA